MPLGSLPCTFLKLTPLVLANDPNDQSDHQGDNEYPEKQHEQNAEAPWR
jgi:hypothetical protein